MESPSTALGTRLACIMQFKGLNWKQSKTSWGIRISGHWKSISCWPNSKGWGRSKKTPF